MPATYPAINERGILYALQQEFVRQLRRPLAGYALYGGRETRVGDWGNEEVHWREVSDLSDVVVSMDIPPVQSDSGTVEPHSLQTPFLSKDLEMGGRKFRQVQLSGLDPVALQELPWAMARDVNHILLFGFGGPYGPSTGLLNGANIQTTSGGNWENSATPQDGAYQMNMDLGKAIAALLSRQMTGPFDLVMASSDMDVFNNFIGRTNTRIGDNLPGTITRILHDSDITAGNAYLVARDPGVYDVVSPRDGDGFTFGLGNVTTGLVNPAAGIGGTQQTETSEMFRSRVVRFINILAPRVLRSSAAHYPVQEITWTRA